MCQIVSHMEKIERLQNIDSEFIEAIDYWNGSLYVKLDGKIYRYDYIDQEVYLSFQEANSKGRFYLNNIKGKYKSTKLN